MNEMWQKISYIKKKLPTYVLSHLEYGNIHYLSFYPLQYRDQMIITK